MTDQFKTIAESGVGEYKAKGSKFLAYAFPVKTEEDFHIILERLKKEHFKAAHHCYAYRLGVSGDRYRVNDDGEPSGTAGRPILGQIDSRGLTNVGIIVVRYFGGTLLGVSGLIKAYKESSADALARLEVVEKIVENRYKITFSYESMPDVLNAFKKLHIELTNRAFGENGVGYFLIRQSKSAATLICLKAMILKISVEEAIMTESTADFEFTEA